MNVEVILRRLSGAVRNAVVWSGAWSTLAFAVVATMRIAGGAPAGVSLGDGIVIGVKFGIIGGIAGAVFGGLISLLYHGRRLSEIDWVRFGACGAAVAGLFVPAFLLTANLLSGDAMPPLGAVLDDGFMAAVFGGVTAGGSMKLAQRANVPPPLGVRARARYEEQLPRT